MKFDLIEIGEKFGLTPDQTSTGLFVVGILGSVGALISADIAGSKREAIMADHLDRIHSVKVAMKETEVPEDLKKLKSQLRREYFKTGGKLVKNYALTGALEGLSLASFAGSRDIQNSQIAAGVAAYSSLSEAFKAYQENNIKLNGQENHKMCKYGFKEVETTDEAGNTVVKRVAKEARDLAEENACPEYYYILNKDNSGLTGDAATDIQMLAAADREIKILVESRGWAVMNDYLDLLHAERTKTGMCMGWTKGGATPNANWDASVNNKMLAGYNNEDVVLEFTNTVNVFTLLNKQDRAQMELGRSGPNEIRTR